MQAVFGHFPLEMSILRFATCHITINISIRMLIDHIQQYPLLRNDRIPRFVALLSTVTWSIRIIFLPFMGELLVIYGLGVKLQHCTKILMRKQTALSLLSNAINFLHEICAWNGLVI